MGPEDRPADVTTHAPTIVEVERIIDELADGFSLDLDDTEAVVARVVDRLMYKLYSTASQEMTRGAALIVLQRRDLLAGADPRRRLLRDGDVELIEETLRNADTYNHELRDRLEGP